MTRIIVGFDPSRGQAAIAELRSRLAPGVEWRVLNLQQNPNGVQPVRPTAEQEQYNEQHAERHSDQSPDLIQRLTGLFGKGDGDEEQEGPRVGSPQPPHSLGPLDLTEEELEYLRRAPARAGTVIILTAPDTEDATVRAWSVRHGGFSLAPVQPDATDASAA